jgi:peptide/nickel transport system substrate-binding protein
MINLLKSALLGATLLTMTASLSCAEPKHGIAMIGEPALPADFKYFPYVNPDAPKGGTISYGVIGTFDNLNPFILKSMGTTARGVIDTAFGNLVFESLMQRSADEPFTLYPLIAESIDTNDERTWVEFQINPNAKWSDGKPVTPEDVIFTYEIFTAKGRPPYNERMQRISKIEKTGERGVKFTLNDQSNREFPLILGLTPIIPKHATNAEKFDETVMTPLVGSGPYLIDTVTPGERIVYKRNPQYWAKDLPAKIGVNNYDTVTVDYFRNETSQFEAFKKGLFDVYPESDPAKWETNFNFPAVTEGKVKKEAFTSGTPANMYGFVFNTRRPVFSDVKVRTALSMLYDFEWTNKNLFAGKYARTGSYWQNSELSALGKPASDAEKTLLGADVSKVLPEVIDGTYKPSETDGSGRDREVIMKAVSLLKEAGYGVKDRKMVGADGKPLVFEIMTVNESEEKLALVYQRTLAKIGIDAQIRTVDDAQGQKRRRTWEYDMFLATFSASLSPGIEQQNRWGSKNKDREGSFNYAGVGDPTIDRMIDAVGKARSQDELTTAVRALDRLLISGQYFVPLHHLPEQWLARWEKIERPEKTPLFGYQLATWWAKPQ